MRELTADVTSPTVLLLHAGVFRGSNCISLNALDTEIWVTCSSTRARVFLSYDICDVDRTKYKLLFGVILRLEGVLARNQPKKG